MQLIGMKQNITVRVPPALLISLLGSLSGCGPVVIGEEDTGADSDSDLGSSASGGTGSRVRGDGDSGDIDLPAVDGIGGSVGDGDPGVVVVPGLDDTSGGRLIPPGTGGASSGVPLRDPVISGSGPLEGCGPASQSQERDWCEVDYKCDQGYVWASCGAYDGGWQCQCESPTSTVSVELGDAEASDACILAADVCTQEIELGEPGQSCGTVYEEQESGYCDLEYECKSEVVLINDARVAATSWGWTWCQRGTSGWDCFCQGDDSGEVSLHFTPVDGGGTACSQATTICHDAPAEIEGPVSCEKNYQSADSNYCSSDLQCGQEAEVNGVGVSINQYVYTYCEGFDNDEWGCFCEGLGISEAFTMSGDSGWDTCSQASDRCADFVAEQSN